MDVNRIRWIAMAFHEYFHAQAFVDYIKDKYDDAYDDYESGLCTWDFFLKYYLRDKSCWILNDTIARPSLIRYVVLGFTKY